MPDGFRVPQPQTVIYQCAEDNVADTVKLRLIAADADCEKVAYIVDDSGRLTLEDDRIEEAIIRTEARMFILDPLQAFLAGWGYAERRSDARYFLKAVIDCRKVQLCHCPHRSYEQGQRRKQHLPQPWQR